MSRWSRRKLAGDHDGAPPPGAIPGTPGNDRYYGISGVFDMSQGGDDRLRFKGSDDTVYFGAAFTGADKVVGGKGTDTVILDGDYSAGVEVRADCFDRIEKLVLVGGSYVVTGELGFEYGSYGAWVDATGLSASQSLDLRVATIGNLFALGGAGDDVIWATSSGQYSYLVGFDGDDTLIGGPGASTFAGVAGADRIVLSNSGDVAQYFAGDSVAKAFDTIENFAASGGRIQLLFDSDTSTSTIDHDFSFEKTADRTGNILFKYDAASDETIVKVFTDPDHKADMVLHLTGDVPLTPADFIFG
jgi:Ca2+-binding RTX toxin-like protein